MYLFVYGTLLSSIPSRMSRALKRRANFVGKATVDGTLYDLGQYPGFVSGTGGKVRGELFSVSDEQAEQLLTLLDAYEGVTGEAEDEYRRTEVQARVADGGPFTALTYELCTAPAAAPEIPLGNYLAFYRSSEAHRNFAERA